MAETKVAPEAENDGFADIQTKFEAYTGDEPYIFISYSHRDTAKVFPIIFNLMENGYRSKSEIMNEHLEKVYAISQKYNLKPMMWGDMFLDNKVFPYPYARNTNTREELTYNLDKLTKDMYMDISSQIH